MVWSTPNRYDAAASRAEILSGSAFLFQDPVFETMGMNDKNSRLFLACFMTLIAAGIGFAVRGEILGAWSAQFGFTQLELGTITGGGLTGFGIFLTENVGRNLDEE